MSWDLYALVSSKQAILKDFIPHELLTKRKVTSKICEKQQWRTSWQFPRFFDEEHAFLCY